MGKSLKLKILATVLIAGSFIGYAEKANASMFSKLSRLLHRSSSRRSSSSNLRGASSLVEDPRGIYSQSLRTESSLRGSNGSLASVSLSRFGIDDSNEDTRPVFVSGSKDGYETNTMFGHSVYEFDFDDAGEINPNHWYHQYKLQNREVVTVVSNKKPVLLYKAGSFQTDEKGEPKFKYVNWLSGKELLEFKKQSTKTD